MPKSSRFYLVALLLILSSLVVPGVLAAGTPRGAEGPTLYVVMPVDTEDYDWRWYALEPKQRDGNPQFDTSQFKPKNPDGSPTDMATAMDRTFRNAHRDSFGGTFKMSWFAMMDQHYDRAVYKDEGPAHPELTGKPVGYTGLLDTLNRYWGRQIQSYGDGLYWHHHVMDWTGSAWVDNSSAPDGYTHNYDALNRMILDQQFFPSAYRAGWGWENGDFNKFLERWIPFDFSALPTVETAGTPSDWKPYHPNSGNPWSPDSPNLARWMSRAAGEIKPDDPHLDAAFQLAASEGKAIYAVFTHNRDDMAYGIDWLHNALVAGTAKYPNVKFKYVTALEAMQQYLGLKDGADPRVNIKKADATSYKVTANEPVWNGKPYVAAKYVGGSEEFYEQIDVTDVTAKTWKAKVPGVKLLAPPDEVAPEYHPVAFAASGIYLNPLYYGPERAHDGSDNTFWDSWDGRGDGRTTYIPAWIQMDLGEVKTIDMITLQWLHDWDRKYSYYMEASTDGSSWTRIGEADMAVNLVTHDLSPDDSTPPPQLRYLKVTVTASSEASAHLCEIRFFGTPYPENEPESPKRLALTKVGAAANDMSGNAQVDSIKVRSVSPMPRVAQRAFQAEYKTDAPKEWKVGEKKQYQVTVTNKGKETWRKSGRDAVQLSVNFGNESERARDGWEREQRFDLPKDVAPGESATFTVSVTAPDKPNLNYVLRHRLVRGEDNWFEQTQRNTVKVLPPSLVANLRVDSPNGWMVSQSKKYDVIVRNQGSEPWKAGEVKLGVHFGTKSDKPLEGWVTDQRFDLPADLLPGKSVTVKVEVTAPAKEGDFLLVHQMVKGTDGWFDEVKQDRVKVEPVTMSAGLSVSPSREWGLKQTKSYKVSVTNRGNVAWKAGGDVVLGIHFGTQSDKPLDGWVTDERFGLTKDLEPGRSVILDVTVTSPAVAGEYILRHQMVQGNNTWFGEMEKDSVKVGQ